MDRLLRWLAGATHNVVGSLPVLHFSGDVLNSTQRSGGGLTEQYTAYGRWGVPQLGL